MEQGRNMKAYTGMRKGISLVEILIAIVLFGVVTTISFTYYKTYYDTAFAAKQTRVYTIMDQASQLNNAFQLYNTKNGQDPADVDAMVTDRQLTAVPVKQPFVSDTGWELDTNLSLEDNATGTGVGFVYKIDGLTASNQDKLDYCNILNNTGSPAGWGLNLTDGNITGSDEMWRRGDANDSEEFEYFSCAEDNASDTYSYKMIFVYRSKTD